MKITFSEIVTTETQLREVIGDPVPKIVGKTISVLDEHCRAFIAKSPFVLIASSNSRGNVDISPKGDPPGFVQVLDDHMLAIPDRPGNRRADTFSNVLQNAKIGLLFLIPGKQETLRVSGSAMIVRDRWLREQLVMQEKVPDLALVVTVEEAFIHCAKCVIRSSLWEKDQWPNLEDLAPLARIMIDHAKLTHSVEEEQTLIDQIYRDHLY